MNDLDCFKELLAQLREKYKSKLVAILDAKIIAVSEDLEGIASFIERKERSNEIKGTHYTGRMGDDILAISSSISF